MAWQYHHICDVAHQNRDFAGEVNFEFSIWCITVLFDIKALSQLYNDTSFIRIEQGIQILQLKRDQNFLLFSLLFSECSHLYLRKDLSAKYTCLCATSHIFVGRQYVDAQIQCNICHSLYCHLINNDNLSATQEQNFNKMSHLHAQFACK